MEITIKNLQYYSKLFCQIIRGRDTHNNRKELAPYKPLLLLAVIELIEEGIIQDNKILVPFAFSVLEKRFKKYQVFLAPSYYRGGIAQPFFYLISDSFWHLKEKPESRGIIDAGEKLKTKKKIRENIEYAYLDYELFDLLKDSYIRKYLNDVILDKYFPNHRNINQKL